MNDFIYYKLGEKTAKVPVDKQAEFESKAPTAKILYTYKGKNVSVPLDARDEFISKAGAENLTYSYYDDNNEYSLDMSTRKIFGNSETVKDSKPTIKESGTHEDASAKDDKTSIFETIGKGVGAAGVGTAKLALDLGRAAWNTSVIGGAANKIKQWMNPEYGSMDERLRDESNPLTRASMNLGELQERLSREADPTGGQMGFGELLKEGKVGMALQKALGSGLESLPMMVAAGTGVGSLVYGAALAAGTYADETRDNPEIPAWKRGINSIGSAALEMAVEKIGGPLKNLGGKAAKEITEETATEILKNFAKEGTETVSKRIFNTLKNIGKEGLEEGGEELLTSFGNDALGEALDLIDGDKDYGIRAQWEQMKEQDPNADLGDFAKSKAKEYFDAFLGGALSGMEISGTVQGINAAATPKNDMQRRYDLGASLDYQDMYDADEVVKESADIAAKSFEDKDGKSSISREFLDGLSADETYNLSRSDEFSNEQRIALRNLAGAKAMQNGLNDKLDTRLDAEIASARAKIEKASNEDGSIVVGIYNNSPVYVKGAVVKNETVTLPNGNDGPVIIVDPKTGEETTVNSKDVSSATSDSYSNFFSNVEEGLRLREQERRNTARNTMSLKAKYNAIKPYVGKKIMVDLGNGIIEVGVQQILPESGEVLVKGKKGDLGGNAIEKIGIGAFYDSIARDDAGNPMFAEGEIETEVEPGDTTVEAPQEAGVSEEDDFRDTVAPILINGVPVEVEVVSQDNATNRIVYRYTDENGQERTGTASIGEFKTALQKAQEYKPEEPIAPEVPTEAPTVEATTEPTPTPAPTDVPTEIEPIAEEINWDALFEQDQEAFFAELQKQFGEETLDILNDFVSAAQEELDSLNKKKRSSNPNDILATRKQKAALQKRIDAYNQMIARLTPAPETPVVEEPTSETPVETTPTEWPTVEPAHTEPVEETPVTEVPTDGKSENGFEFNKHNVCTNPEVISVPSVKKGWAVMNEVRLAEFNGKWGSAIDAHTGTGGVGIPLTKSDCKFDTKEEAIADAYKALVGYRASRNGDTGLKDLDNLIKHLEKEYPFVKEAATPTEPAETTLAPQPAPAEPITTENGFVIVDKVITNPEVIEMPNTPEGDANRIFIGEYNGKWTYGAEALMDNGSWGMTPQMRIENAKYDTREEAIKAAISFLENQWRDKRKNAGSTALDAFVQYVKENYLPKASETNGDSVSLNTEPTVESNGEQGSEVNDGSERHSSTHGSKLSYDRGTEDDSEKIERVRGSEVNQGERIEDKYPPRKGNASRQLLMDTFKFTSVSPGVSQKNLNDIYDFLMEMSKLLGISPTSIGQGQTLGLGVLGESVTDKYATYEYKYYRGGIISSPYMRFKNSLLSSVAHEWWHSLDQALSYYETGKGIMPASKAASSEFSGRPEVLSAVKDIIDAIKNSGHIERLDKELADNSTALSKSKLDTELAARFFEGYIKAKFAELGINVNGFVPAKTNNPTEEEVKQVIPAFDKLFDILKEKEGKKEGSTILYHIGEMMEQNNEAKNQLGALVADWIQQGGNFVVMDNEAMLNALEESGNARMLETPDGAIYGFVKDGVVYLNPSLLNANTSIHEYTHLWDNALMQLNRPLWEKGKALMKKTALWKEVVNDPNYADIKDNEDLVASEVHSRLVGAEGAKRLEQLEQEAREKGLTKGAKDLSILGRLREWLNEAAKWLKDTFSVWSKEEIDAVSLDDFLNMPLRDLANFTALPQTESGQITNENGDLVANNNGNGHIQFSISTWREGGRDYLANWLANDKTLAEDEKADILARMDEFYENAQKYTDVYVPFGTWSEAAVKYDKDGNPLMSVIKANGDYSMNLDFSLVCKKRRPLNMLLRELINRNAFASYTLRERELAEINWILQEHGFEVACALCFVDAKRFRVTGVADVFATLYNRFVKALAPDGAQIAHFNYSNNPNVEAVENGIDTMSDEQLNWKKFDALAKKYGPKTVEGKVAKFLRENPSQRRLVDATDFIDANGFEAVKEGNPTLLSLYNSKKGTGGPKASFGDVQYLNDILKKEKSFDVEKAYAVGGVRLQSFSDFVPHMYFDYMQLFAELAAKKLPAHAYTKEVLFAKIFGMTGIKINMSLVPSVVEGGVAPGLDANGNYAWADAIKDKDGNVIQQAQSFPFDEAMAIQNAEGYSKNCGVIAVGISDAHILKMLNDPNIPFIIPYHKSSLNAIVARMTNIDQYKDYTNVQNTRKADGTKLAKGTPDFNFNAYLRENPEATPQQAAQAYLDWCKEHNYRPKFSQFASHPNYYKLLQDFNTIDAVTGEYTPQGAVTMTFPTEQSEFGNVESLIQQGLQEDAELEEKMSSEISSIADKVIDRLKEIEKEPKLSEKKYAEQMAKLADERQAKISAMANVTAEEYGDGILSRSGDITPEMDAAYMEAVERGDMETAQRMVNEAADKYLNEMLLPDDSDEVGFKYHRGPAPTKTFKRYAVFNVSKDGFRAAYAGNANPTPVGVWLDAQNLQSYTSDMVQFDDGTFATYIAGDTGAATNTKFSPEKAEELGVKGGQRWLLERGGKHSSDVPNFSQMNLKTNENGEKVSSAKDGALPHNKLIFEIEYGISEDGNLTDYVRENGRMMKGKNQGLAKIGENQYYDFKTNPNAVGNWGIGGTFRITRLVPHSEVVSVTEQYKKDAIAEANRLYENGEISKKDRDARVKSAESIQVQKWVGGYNPADFGLSEDVVSQMAEEGSKMKLTDPVTYDDNGNIIPLSDRFNPEKKDIRYRKADAQNAAVDYLAGEPRSRVIENAVNEEAAKLGVTVTYKTRSEMPNGHKNDKGYYNTKTGEIVICPENNASISDAIQTILHEAVAHKGLRQLMGDRFDEFINRVYDALDAETKAKVDELAAKHYNGNKAVAMEEYMATLAESENFAETSAWDKIKSIFEKIINSILGRNDIKIGDNELRYILRASYANMVNPRNMETIEGWAKDTNMREEYKINEATPEILSRTGIDPTEAASETAKQVYGRVIQDNWNEFQRQFQDDKQPVRIAIDAIQQETGNVPIEDYENYILISNQASSRSRVEIDKFARKYYSPIIDKTNRIIDKILEKRGFNIKDEAKRAEVYAEIRQYLIAKHGLERNAYYQATKTKIVDGEEVPDIRDYSGLTALFGMDKKQFREAEAEAERLVESFEAEMGDMTAELWKKINAATNKTLRHSYECGMISRQQYNEIKGMFQYYIPLRGFDETTAEDVYSYARFEGNRFNPAVVKTGGRTSLADDPLAIIMNMAESEIAQGNKNRAKQALYNYILNRPIVDADGNQRQNTLMQIEDVWYMKDADGTYSIAAPNHEIGETYEEFENKIQALAEKDMAKKSKRGHVDVGMRFQKRTNENAHYIYLKVNGVEKAIYINGDPKAAEAVNGSYKAKPMYGEGKMRDINRLLSSTFTNYSLEFTARNYFRDMIYSHINIGVRESDPAYRKKFRQNWRRNNLPTMMKMLKAYRAGEFEGRLLTEDEAAFVEFMENGGQTGYTLINSVENHKKDLERAIKNMQNGIEKGGIKDSTAFKYTLGAIETLNEASELVTRFAAFKTSRDMGRGIETSINDAKEITVNFNTKGAQDGRGWMGMIAQYFGWSKFFFNASVQGVQNVKAMASANKTKFGTVVGGIIATGFFMPLITAAISELFGGDDEEEYWNIPEYDRQNNLCIVVGDSYAKIPLPIGFREIYAIGDMVAAMAFDKKFTRDFTQVGTDIANKLASVILPINPLESAANGLSIWHTALYAGLPSSLQFAIQNMTNIDWKGAPLQKEYTYNENDPQWMKAYASNPDWMVSLSKWCNEHINADGDFDGWDWSPEKLDNTLSNLLGGIYSLIKKSGRSISMIWNEENRNLSNIPLTGVVMGSNLDKDDSFVNNAYYDMKEYYDENIGTIERTAKAFGLSLKDVFEGDKIGAHHPKMQQIYSNRNFDWMQEWYLGDKELKSIRDKIKRREKKMNASENPSQELLEEIATLNGAYNTERRDFVNDMLELD